MKVLATMKANDDETRDKVYGIITAKDKNMYCRECEIVFEFSEEEIDRTKALPHITCPGCEKELQLPSKYKKK